MGRKHTIILDFTLGHVVYRMNSVEIGKPVRKDVLLTIAHNLYRRHWIMRQYTRKDETGSDVLDRVELTLYS